MVPVAPITVTCVPDTGEKVVRPRSSIRRFSSEKGSFLLPPKIRGARQGGKHSGSKPIPRKSKSCRPHHEEAHVTSCADMPQDVGRASFRSMLDGPSGTAPGKEIHDDHMDNLSVFLVEVVIAPNVFKDKISASRGEKCSESGNQSIEASDLPDDSIADNSTEYGDSDDQSIGASDLPDDAIADNSTEYCESDEQAIEASDLLDDAIADNSTELLDALHKATSCSSIVRGDARQHVAEPDSNVLGIECHIGFLHPDEQGIMHI